ncbi:MAG: glycosyltransferase family 4 protein [Candidatus Niyogibacteria bacterium]|nr:glycosyltransferase family 4 protein [Candidatus Niyogibacteria bacterium]
MKILMLSGDPQILNAVSDSAQRMKDYGRIVGRLDIFVFAAGLGKGAAPALALSPHVSAEAVTGRLLRFWRAYARASRRLSRERYDLITAQDAEHACIAWFLSRRFKIPWQMQLHTDIFNPRFVRHSFTNRLRAHIAAFLLPRASGVRAVSFRITRSFPSEKRAVILPIWVDVRSIRKAEAGADLRAKYPAYEKIILMAGRLTREKNFPRAIRAMKQVLMNHPRALLVIAGSGPQKQTIIREAYRAGVAGHVALEGAVSFETLVSYYKTADLYVLTSEYEGYGRTLVEAAAAGCPIVSTDVGVAEEIKGAFVVPVGDEQALADAMARQLNIPRMAPQLPAMPSWGDYCALLKRSFAECIHHA